MSRFTEIRPSGDATGAADAAEIQATVDEVGDFDDFVREQMRDPAFRAAYEAAARRYCRAYRGYRGLAYNSEYRRRLRARRWRKR